MALNDEIDLVCEKWAEKLGNDLTDSMLKALKDAGRTNPSATNLRFEPELIREPEKITVNILAIGANGEKVPYWYWIEYGRKKGKQPPSEVFGKKWQDGQGINARKIIAEINLKKKGLKKQYKQLNYDKSVKTLAFLIARSIGKKGYKARPFIDRVINDGRVNDLAEQLANVMGKNLVIELDINGSN